jgi:hypothetical protein
LIKKKKVVNVLLQLRNELGLDLDGVEESDGESGCELAGGAGYKERDLPEPSSVGLQVGAAAGKLAQGIFED